MFNPITTRIIMKQLQQQQLVASKQKVFVPTTTTRTRTGVVTVVVVATKRKYTTTTTTKAATAAVILLSSSTTIIPSLYRNIIRNKRGRDILKSISSPSMIVAAMTVASANQNNPNKTGTTTTTTTTTAGRQLDDAVTDDITSVTTSTFTYGEISNLFHTTSSSSSKHNDEYDNNNNNNVYDINVTNTDHLLWYHITQPITSTQDEIRKLLHYHAATTTSTASNNNGMTNNNKAIAVLADIQLQGRGTQGRKWEMGDPISSSSSSSSSFEETIQQEQYQKDNNMYLTIAIPYDTIPISITLLPLQIGIFVVEKITQIIHLCRNQQQHQDDDNNNDDVTTIDRNPPKVTVKWPNDVLINQKKVSGTLIETESVTTHIQDTNNNNTKTTTTTTWMLIGIGINVASIPRNISTSPGKHIRQPCCIQEFCYPSSIVLPSHTAIVLGHDLASTIANWVYNKSTTTTTTKVDRDRHVIQQWKSYTEFNVLYELRGRVVTDETVDGYVGEIVTTMDIEYDGQLRVRDNNGIERLLVADYLH